MSPDDPRASEELRVPGLDGPGEYRQSGADRLRSRREAKLRGLLGRAAGVLRADVEVAPRCTQTHPGRQVWHPGPTGRASAWHEHLVEICLNRGSSLEDAKELAQEAHLRLLIYQRSTPVRDAESLLRRIVINLSINHYHRELSRMPVFESIDKLERKGILIDPKPGPERTLAAEQQLDRVVSLISAMSPRTCQIFVAQRGGYSYEEVSAAFAIKPRTVEKHVTVAATTLSEMMPTHFPEECASASLKAPGLRGDSRDPQPAIRPHPLEAPTPGYRAPRIRDAAFLKSS